MDNISSYLEFIPTISVVLIVETDNTYALEKSLSSLVSQIGSFRSEIIIVLKEYNEKIADICQTFKAIYPDKIRFHTRIISGSAYQITIYGNYIFVCRENEFFNDNKKLRIQSEFLNTHPKYSICFHNVVGSGYPLIPEGDYLPKRLSLNTIIKFYSPLIRIKQSPIKINLLLLERNGCAIFARDSHSGLMRCLNNISSIISTTGRRATLLKNF